MGAGLTTAPAKQAQAGDTPPPSLARGHPARGTLTTSARLPTCGFLQNITLDLRPLFRHGGTAGLQAYRKLLAWQNVGRPHKEVADTLRDCSTVLPDVGVTLSQ